MSAPILFTSIALLAGVAARPVNPERVDDLAEYVRSPPESDRQAFLGRLPSESLNSLNSLQLHDLHDTTGPNIPDDALAGSASPRLKGAVPDPGLQSPYFGAQHRLSPANTDLLGLPALSPSTPEPISPVHIQPTESKDGNTQFSLEQPDYSPIVVYLVASSIASLILLGLAVVVVRVSQLYRQTVLQSSVWEAVTFGRGKKENGLATSEKEKVDGRVSKLISGGNKDKILIAAREVPTGFQPTDPIDLSEKHETVDDSAETSLPESSAPAVRENPNHPSLAVVLKAWTLDNWVTHFMIALFGWIGVLFRGRQQP